MLFVQQLLHPYTTAAADAKEEAYPRQTVYLLFAVCCLRLWDLQMLKQCLDFLLNLNDEQLTSLKQRVLQLLERRQQRQQHQQQMSLPPASSLGAHDVAAGGQGVDGKAEAESCRSSPQPPASSDAQETEEPWGPERLLQNCPEADVALIPKQLEALQRLQSPLDRQTEVRPSAKGEISIKGDR